MATSSDKTNQQHQARVNSYAKKVDAKYKSTWDAIMRIAASSNIDPTKPFALKDYPSIAVRVEHLLNALYSSIDIEIKSAIDIEWEAANSINDQLVLSTLTKVDEKMLEGYMNGNKEAREAFKNRVEGKMNLSDRVWNLKGQTKQELEMAIDVGIADGKSAAEMSRDVRQYLNEPNKLFRRVRDLRGQLQLSKAAQNFKSEYSGRGHYKSSYKNAMRLTRTETNIAYHNANFERWQQLDFIVGVEVKLSNNHTNNGVPFTDVCDDLKGKYPKDFKFVGWHPQCRCHIETIMMTNQELNDTEMQLMNDEPVQTDSKNTVKSVPQNFKKWTAENKERIDNWKSKPYFIRDNPDYFKA